MRTPEHVCDLVPALPSNDLRNEFHEYHVVPKAILKKKGLVAAGLDPEQVEAVLQQVNMLPNLQLLEGSYNQQKSAKLPSAWLEQQFPDVVSRNAYVAKHDLGELPADVTAFPAFFEARRTRLANRLKRLLGMESGRDSGV